MVIPMVLKRFKEVRSGIGRYEMSGDAVRRRTDKSRYEFKKELKNRSLVVFNDILRLERYLISVKNLWKPGRVNRWDLNGLK